MTFQVGDEVAIEARGQVLAVLPDSPDYGQTVVVEFDGDEAKFVGEFAPEHLTKVLEPEPEPHPIGSIVRHEQNGYRVVLGDDAYTYLPGRDTVLVGVVVGYRGEMRFPAAGGQFARHDFTVAQGWTLEEAA